MCVIAYGVSITFASFLYLGRATKTNTAKRWSLTQSSEGDIFTLVTVKAGRKVELVGVDSNYFENFLGSAFKVAPRKNRPSAL